MTLVQRRFAPQNVSTPMRFCLIAILPCLAAFTGSIAADERPLPKVKHMIDTHIHLYDTTREKGVPNPADPSINDPTSQATIIA